jgi:hypothetical protein
MLKVNTIRSIVVTAAVLSMMAISAGPAQADSNQSCSQRGGHGDNTVTCGDTSNGLINVDIGTVEILNDNDIDILEKGINTYILNNSLNCNSILPILSATCAKGLILVIVDVHKLIGVELKWIVVKVGSVIERKDCPCH